MFITFTLKVLPLTHKRILKIKTLELRLQNEALGAARCYSRRSLLIDMPLETSSKFGKEFIHQFIIIATNQPFAFLQAFNQIVSIQVEPTEYSLYYWKPSYTELFCGVVRITANTSFVESCRPALKKSLFFILYVKVCPSKMWRSSL